MCMSFGECVSWNVRHRRSVVLLFKECATGQRPPQCHQILPVSEIIRLWGTLIPTSTAESRKVAFFMGFMSDSLYGQKMIADSGYRGIFEAEARTVPSTAERSPVMKGTTSTIIRTAMSTDSTVRPDQREAALSILNEKSSPSLIRLLTPILLTQSEAARMLNVCRVTVYRMAKEGVLKPVWIRGAKRYRREDVERVAKCGTLKGECAQ